MSSPSFSRHPMSSRNRQYRRSVMSSVLPLVLALVLYPTLASAADLTLYTAQPGVTTTINANPSGSYSGLPAYDPTRLTPPTPPQPPTTSYTLTMPGTKDSALQQGASVSMPQSGNFLGFSVELSVANQILGRTGGTLNPQFLNYLANIQTRAGVGPIVRVGGNTQDSSTLFVDGFGNGRTIEKVQVGQDKYGNAINTPVINFSLELFYAMANISSLVDTHWFFGLAFNESDVEHLTDNPPLVAEYAQKILGDHLDGLVVGNEPDLYVRHNHRPEGWNVTDYIQEYDTLTQEILNGNFLVNKTAFAGPSLCCDVPGFMFDDVVNAGYLSAENLPYIAHVTAQNYPTNNCQLGGVVINPQDIFADFLNHTSAVSLTAPFLPDIATVRAAGKEMMMMEMNSASCGGFPGLSDSFGVAMWMTDWALQMAYANFTSALMHVGGQNVYYNPFTPPPSNFSKIYEWTTGSVYYSTLVVAETFGKSGNGQIVDLNANNGDIYHPAYLVYEGETPTRAVLFNYVSDDTGASDIQITLNLAGDQLADQVSVRYFRADSVSEQYNITWAGQTMGASFSSDGRLHGDIQTTNVTCTDGNCVINVPAPSIALVFLTPDALTESSVSETATASFATTVVGTGDATVNPGALATGNGMDPDKMGSTSKGSREGGAASQMARVGSSTLALLVIASALFALS